MRTQADRDDDLAIGRELERKDAEIDRLQKRLKRCEASLSVWDENCDSRYWQQYPDAAERVDHQQRTSEPRSS